MSLELGTWIVPAPGTDAEETVEVERLGFDVSLYGDSQMIFADPYVRMAYAAAATSQIVVAPGIAAPATRDSSVTAACLGAVHVESGGRARLCIGAGDSALSSIGRRAPLRLADFERYVHEVRGYLRGAEVYRDGTATRMHWLPGDLPPVEVDVSATGPRTIATAARIADRVTLNLGARPERVEWGVEVARASRRDARIGAWITVAVGDCEEQVIDGIRSACVAHARFPGLGSGNANQAPDRSRQIAAALTDVVDRTTPGSRIDLLRRAAALVADDDVRWFAAVGTASQVAARLRELMQLGVRHLYIIFGDPTTDRDFMRRSRLRFVDAVVPALRDFQAVA